MVAIGPSKSGIALAFSGPHMVGRRDDVCAERIAPFGAFAAADVARSVKRKHECWNGVWLGIVVAKPVATTCLHLAFSHSGTRGASFACRASVHAHAGTNARTHAHEHAHAHTPREQGIRDNGERQELAQWNYSEMHGNRTSWRSCSTETSLE
jgi:hypothetical protein